MGVDLRGNATGSFFTHHDARYLPAQGGLTGGTLVDPDGVPGSMGRRTLANGVTDGVSGEFWIDANWRAVALRWGWLSEAAGAAGNIKFRVRYGLVYPLLGANAKTITLTTITIPAQACPTTDGGSAYALPAATEAIPTPVDGFLGTAPGFAFAIERLGGDATDTAERDISIYIATITRVD